MKYTTTLLFIATVLLIGFIIFFVETPVTKTHQLQADEEVSYVSVNEWKEIVSLYDYELRRLHEDGESFRGATKTNLFEKINTKSVARSLRDIPPLERAQYVLNRLRLFNLSVGNIVKRQIKLPRDKRFSDPR